MFLQLLMYFAQQDLAHAHFNRAWAKIERLISYRIMPHSETLPDNNITRTSPISLHWGLVQIFNQANSFKQLRYQIPNKSALPSNAINWFHSFEGHFSCSSFMLQLQLSANNFMTWNHKTKNENNILIISLSISTLQNASPGYPLVNCDKIKMLIE